MEQHEMLNVAVKALELKQQDCKKNCNTFSHRGSCAGCNLQTLIDELPKYILVKNPSTELEL